MTGWGSGFSRFFCLKNPGEKTSLFHSQPHLAIGFASSRIRNPLFSPTDWERSAQSNALGTRTPDETQPEGLRAALSIPNATFVPYSRIRAPSGDWSVGTRQTPRVSVLQTEREFDSRKPRALLWAEGSQSVGLKTKACSWNPTRIRLPMSSRHLREVISPRFLRRAAGGNIPAMQSIAESSCRVGGGFAQPTSTQKRWVAQSLHPPYRKQITASFVKHRKLAPSQIAGACVIISGRRAHHGQ